MMGGKTLQLSIFKKEKPLVEGIPDGLIQLHKKTDGNQPNEAIDRYELVDSLTAEFSKTYASLINAVARGQQSQKDMKNELRKFINQRAQGLEFETISFLQKTIHNYIFGYDVLTPFLEMDGISDLRIVDENNVRIKRNGIRRSTKVKFRNRRHMESFIEFVCTRNGVFINNNNAVDIFTDKKSSDMYILRIDITDSFVNTDEHSYLHIRFIPKVKREIPELINLRMLNVEMANYFREAYGSGCSIVTCGKNGSGKSTLMSALLELIPHDKSAMVVQESEELFCHTHPEMTFHKTVYARGDMKADYTLKKFARFSNVSDIDYLIIGEIKGEEAFDMINGTYTGQTGLTSIHADSAMEAPDKFVHYMKYVSDLSRAELLRMLASLNIIVFNKDFKCQEVIEIEGFDEKKGELIFRKIFEFRVQKIDGKLYGKFVRLNESCDRVRSKIEYAQYMRAERGVG